MYGLDTKEVAKANELIKEVKYNLLLKSANEN